MAERTAPQPPRRRDAGPPPAIRVAGPIGRADVPRVTRAAIAALADCPPGIVDCEAADARPAALPAVDALARIALAARRSRHELRLEHASPDLLALLVLCGLGDVVRAGRRRRGGAPTGGEPGAPSGRGAPPGEESGAGPGAPVVDDRRRGRRRAGVIRPPGSG